MNASTAAYTLLLTAIFTGLNSCKSRVIGADIKEDGSPSVPAAVRPAPQLCAAIRGNGNYIFAHWGGMSRILEEFGPLQGVAGGSSGAVTAFLYESIYRNPAVWKCPNGACTSAESGLRMSLLFKSLPAYLAIFREFSGLQSEFTGKNKVLIGLKLRKITRAIASEDWGTAADSIHGLISREEFSGFINQEMVKDLENSFTDDAAMQKQVMKIVGASEALQWKIEDTSVLFRRGLVRMEQLADKAGVIADFLIGLEGSSAADLGNYLDQCGHLSRNRNWDQVASTPTQMKQPDGQPLFCGQLFQNAVLSHLSRIFSEPTEESSIRVITYKPKSINEPVGQYLPVIAANSFFEDRQAISRFELARQSFESTGQPPQLNFDFDHLKFGYYGQEDELAKVMRGAAKRSDLRSRHAASLGQRTWREVLSLSPLEPGLESAQCLVAEATANAPAVWKSMQDVPNASKCIKISTGGWADLEPVAVLKDIGCQDVLLIHRAGGATKFAQTMTGFFTSNPVQRQQVEKELFDLNTDSSYSLSLGLASGVLCTNWDAIEGMDIPCLVQHSYDSKIQTSDPKMLMRKLLRNDSTANALIDGTGATYGCRMGASPASLPPAVQCPEKP